MTRFIAVRLVLIAAILTTVATSAPRNFEISATDEHTLSAGTTRISARTNQIGVAHADQLMLELELRTAMAPMQNTATIVPDDSAIAPETVVVSTGLTDRSYQLLAVCTRDKDCDAGVSIDVSAGSPITVTAIATLVRFARGGGDRSFPNGATVDVGFQP